MNRDEAVQGIDQIINKQLDAGNETINIAGLILDFLFLPEEDEEVPNNVIDFDAWRIAKGLLHAHE